LKNKIKKPNVIKQFEKSCISLAKEGIGFINKEKIDQDLGKCIYTFLSNNREILFQIYFYGIKWQKKGECINLKFEQILSFNSILPLKEIVRLNKSSNNLELVEIGFNTKLGIIKIEIPFVIYSTLLGTLSYAIKNFNG
jgi:hypothetical protein